jgi:hypothetical protein
VHTSVPGKKYKEAERKKRTGKKKLAGIAREKA